MSILLFEEIVNPLTDHEFEDCVQTGAVLVYFYSEVCGPCERLTPRMWRLSEALGQISFYKIDVDHSPENARWLGVERLPTLILFRDGVEIRRCFGITHAEKIRRWILDDAAHQEDASDDST